MEHSSKACLVKAYVTGATGFLGRRLIDLLLAEGWEVTALVRGDDYGLPAAVETVRGDVRDGSSLGEGGAGRDRLFHLAARVTFDPRQRAGLEAANTEGTRNVLEAARRWGVVRSVVASSAITLGLAASPDRPLDEGAIASARLAARNPYLASKLGAEAAAREAAAAGAEVVVVNPTTVYGPGDRTLNSGTLIAQVARAPVVPVPPGGSNAVDVDDVARGFVAAAERGRSGERYVLGGENLRFREIFATVARVVGRRPPLVPLPRPTRPLLEGAAWAYGKVRGDRFLTPQIVGDLFAYKFYACDKARRELGWEPRYGFADSVERAWDYYRREGLL